MQTKAPSENQSPRASRSLTSALEAYRTRLEAMPDESLDWTRGLDVSVCVSIVRGRLPTIRLHREAVLAHFGEHGVALLDELPRLADATLEAHLAWAGSAERVDFAPLHEALRRDHAMLWGDAQSLAQRKLIDRKRLAVARSTHGYHQAVESVEILVLLLREALATGVSTPLRLEELARIEADAERFHCLLCVRQLRKERFPAKETRERMLNLLLRAYDEVRRMLHFVRWHEDDADAIAPSLWIKTGRSKRRAKRRGGGGGGGGGKNARGKLNTEEPERSGAEEEIRTSSAPDSALDVDSNAHELNTGELISDPMPVPAPDAKLPVHEGVVNVDLGSRWKPDRASRRNDPRVVRQAPRGRPAGQFELQREERGLSGPPANAGRP